MRIPAIVSSPFARATAVALALILSGCAKEDPPPPPVPPVVLAQVKAGVADAASVFAGEVKPRHEADLAFRIGGKVVARSVDTGARVRRGQVLARLDPADVGLQTDAAKAALAAAEADHTFARAEAQRFERLHAEKFVSASAVEQKKNLANAALARLDQARAQFAVAQNQAGYATLVAPDDGVITAILAESGQVVAAGQAVMKLAARTSARSRSACRRTGFASSRRPGSSASSSGQTRRRSTRRGCARSRPPSTR